MSAGVGNDGLVRELVQESARWRLAGLLLRRPRPAWRQEIEALSAEAGDRALAAAVAAAAAADATDGAYLALLGPGGPVSPREVSYRPLEDPGRLLAELAAYHDAFAYRASAEDPRDHVAVAADFVGFLALKEAFAVATDRPVDARTTREARERFVARHVAVTARGMARRMNGVDAAVTFLPAALHALAELAGVPGGDLGTEQPVDETQFLRPGLDDEGFGTCAAACAGPTDEGGEP